MDKVLKDKEMLIDKLDLINKELLDATIVYRELKSQLWIDTDWIDAVGKSKPTVDEKKSYIALETLKAYEDKLRAEYKKEIILSQIDLCNDKLSVLL